MIKAPFYIGYSGGDYQFLQFLKTIECIMSYYLQLIYQSLAIFHSTDIKEYRDS